MRRTTSVSPGRRRRKWARRYIELGEAGMADRSSRPHRHPNKTPQHLVKIVHMRIRKRLSPVQVAGRVGMPASTVHAVLTRCRLNRLSHVDLRTGEPARRYEHEKPGALIHVDVKKLGNILTAAAGATSGAPKGYVTEPRHRTRNATAIGTRSCGMHSFTPSSMIIPVSLMPRSTTMTALRPRSACSSARSPGSPTAASESNASCPTTARCIAPTPRSTPAPTSTSHRNSHARDDRRRTERSNASTAPWPTAGPTRSTTTATQPAAPRSPHGCTSTPQAPHRHRKASAHRPDLEQPDWALHLVEQSLRCSAGGAARNRSVKPRPRPARPARLHALRARPTPAPVRDESQRPAPRCRRGCAR